MSLKTIVRHAPRIVFVFGLVVCAGLLAARHRNSPDLPFDFLIYHRASLLARIGQDPYDSSLENAYKYAPVSLALFSLLPRQPATAWRIFKYFNILSWLGTLSLGVIPRGMGDVVLLLLGVALSWRGLIENLSFGQMEIFLLAITLGAFHLLQAVRPGQDQRNRLIWMATAVLLTSILFIKLPWLIFCVPVLKKAVRSSRKTFLEMLGMLSGCSLILAAFLPALVWGPSNTWTWTLSWIRIMRMQPSVLYIKEHNQSIWSTSLRWILLDKEIGGVLSVMLSALTLWLGLRLLREKREFASALPKGIRPLVELTPWWLLCFLLNPLSWRWASLLMVGLPLSISHQCFRQSTRPLLGRAGMVTQLLTLLGLVFLMYVPSLTSSHFNTWGGLCLIWFLSLLLLVNTPQQ